MCQSLTVSQVEYGETETIKVNLLLDFPLSIVQIIQIKLSHDI